MKRRSRRPWIFSGLLLLLLFGCVGLFIWAIQRFGWGWTGFTPYTSPSLQYQRGKTLWDWLQLLIVPAMLAVGAGFFTWWSARTERQIAQQRYEQDRELALEKQREDLLQSYLDRMAELLLDKHLRDSPPEAEVRKVARTRTVSALIQLDSKRAQTVFIFLKEAQLREASDPIISLEGADLSSAKWSQGNLSGVNLSKANLSRADFSRADLSRVDFSGAKLFLADFSGAKLNGANLSGADLRSADLSGADLSDVDLSRADLFRADLIEAKLRKADLRLANLIGANLRLADLIVADLRGANLTLANLKGANLFWARLGEAKLGEANLSRADLRLADLKGANLDSAQFLESVQLDKTDLRGVSGLTAKQLADCKARGAIIDQEDTQVALPSSSAAVALSQQVMPPASPSPGHPSEGQKVPLDVASSQEHAAGEHKAPPIPFSPSQEGTQPASLTQGSATTSSSSQDAAL